jgi:hypothetical protein
MKSTLGDFIDIRLNALIAADSILVINLAQAMLTDLNRITNNINYKFITVAVLFSDTNLQQEPAIVQYPNGNRDAAHCVIVPRSILFPLLSPASY